MSFRVVDEDPVVLFRFDALLDCQRFYFSGCSEALALAVDFEADEISFVKDRNSRLVPGDAQLGNVAFGVSGLVVWEKTGQVRTIFDFDCYAGAVFDGCHA